jgi:hypothetical protein
VVFLESAHINVGMPYLTFFFKLDLFYLNFERYQVLKCIVTQTRTEKWTFFPTQAKAAIVVVQVQVV